MRHFCKHILAASLMLVFVAKSGFGQELSFSQYESYTITLDQLSLDDLVFEGPIVTGGGLYEVELPQAKALMVTGVNYLDAFVQIEADGELLLEGNAACSGDPSCSIPFNLQAAYANRGENNLGDSQYIPVVNNFSNARFPILGRLQNAPGPPPPPPTLDFDQSLVNENAYLYLYGTIDVGNVDAGYYQGTITVTIYYEQADV
ncbi:MAG: hypothetical protein WDZ29_00625 [Balneolaceae bacterium]